MKKILIITLIVFAGLFVLLWGAELVVASKIKKAIEKELSEAQGGAYNTKIGKVSVNLLRRSVTIRNIAIGSDIYQKTDDEDFNEIYANIEKLTAQGIRYKTHDKFTDISVNKIEIVSPYVTYNLHEASDALTDSTDMSMPGRFSGNIKVNRVLIRNGTVEYSVKSAADTVEYRIDKFSLDARGVMIDTSEVKTKKLMYLDDVIFTSDKFSYLFSQGAFLVEVEEIDLSTIKGTLNVNSAKLIPQHSKDRFGWVAPGHADWTQASAEGISVSGIDLDNFVSDNAVIIDSIYIRNGNVESYKNRKIDRVEHIKPLFHEKLQSLPFRLEVRVARVDDMTANYEELAVNGTHPGRIFFTGLSGTFRDVGNRPRPEKPYFTLNAQGHLMGQGLLQANFNLPVDEANKHFTISGSLSPMDMRPLNSIVEPLIKGEVESGTLNGVSFSMSANNHNATSDLVMLYDNLKISILKDNGGEVTERRFLSGIVNFAIIKDSNPDRNGERRISSESTRDPYRSQFNYLWKMLLPGIKRTIGIPDSDTDMEQKDTGREFEGRHHVEPHGLFSR